MTYNGEERRQSQQRRHLDKILVKEALKEWLDEKFTTFGKWSATSLLAIALVGLVYMWMIANGWHK